MILDKSKVVKYILKGLKWSNFYLLFIINKFFKQESILIGGERGKPTSLGKC